jgi:hypothetical protein
VCLYLDRNGDGQVNAGDPLLACRYTDSQGNYAFPNRLPGQYLVVETQPAGLQTTTPNVLPVTLAVVGPSGSAADNNFGELLYVRLGDFVFEDANHNGVQDPGETAGFTGLQLQVTGVDITGGSVNLSVTTAGGSYLVENLLPGIYTVTAPLTFNGYQLSTPGIQTVTLTVSTVQNVSTSSTQDLTLDFGYVRPTGVTVQRFDVSARPGQVMLTWEVQGGAPEGFRVWRAESSKRADATLLTPAPVFADTDGVYHFVDLAVWPRQSYWYWLEDGSCFDRLNTRTGNSLAPRS